MPGFIHKFTTLTQGAPTSEILDLRPFKSEAFGFLWGGTNGTATHFNFNGKKLDFVGGEVASAQLRAINPANGTPGGAIHITTDMCGIVLCPFDGVEVILAGADGASLVDVYVFSVANGVQV